MSSLIVSKPIRGSIHNMDRYKQLLDFSGFAGCFRRAKITPQDIDFEVEEDLCFLWGEYKFGDKELEYGQRLAFERRILMAKGRGVGFVASHNQHPEEIIDAHRCIIREVVYYWDKIERKFPKDTTAEDLARAWSGNHEYFILGYDHIISTPSE